jgi:hypothetical protein
MAIFTKANVIIKFLHYFSFVISQKTPIFSPLPLKIITSVPNWANLRLLGDCLFWAVL